MTAETDPLPEAVEEAAAGLCGHHRSVLLPFLGRHLAHPRFTTGEALRMVRDFARACPTCQSDP